MPSVAASKVDPRCVSSLLHSLFWSLAVERLHHKNTFRLWQGLLNHLPVYRERFDTDRVVWLIYVLSKNRFDPGEHLIAILDSDRFRFHNLPHGTVAYVLGTLSRMNLASDRLHLSTLLLDGKSVGKLKSTCRCV